MDEALQFAIKSGMINLSYVQEKYEMNRREELLSEHKWAISQGKDGYWRTYLPDEEKGRRMIRKKTKEALEKSVIEYYKSKKKEEENREKYKFKNRFIVWMNRQKKCERSDNTIYKYQTDYKRFFAGRKIEDIDVRKMDESDIIFSFKEVLLEKDIPYRALKSVFGYVNGMFEKCIVDKIIEKNPCIYIDLPLLKKYCKSNTDNTIKKRTVSEIEKEKIMNKIQNSSNIAKYAVELAFCTGMRVGELSSLRWSDIDYDENVVTIRSSEKYNRLTKEYFISETKNAKVRRIPLTDDMKKVLSMAKKSEEQNKWLGEFVFSNENGRIHCRTISEWIRNNTETKEFEETKSIHAIRRTINSKMRCAGVPTPVAASILGHTEKVNEVNYTYDVTSMKEKERILKLASGNL